MSETPRTDAESYYVPPTDELHAIDGLTRVVPEEFARTLERELTAAIARAEAAEATVERCKQVCDATAEGWRETQAELDEALAKLARYETLRPASEHDGETTVVIWIKRGWHDSYRPSHFGTAVGMASCWTPLPDVKEASKCWCETCRTKTLADMRMVLCPECGNKRCPKATHHNNECTGSNERGQPGSAYK